MKEVTASTLLLAAMMVCGCTETFTSMRVKKDGTGTIMLRVHMSEDTAGQVARAAAVMTTGATDAMAAAPTSLYDEKRLTQLARLFGNDVTFVSGRESTGKNGWKGFVAWYRFDDVSKVTLIADVGDAMMAVQQAAGKAPETVPGYTFAIEKGEESSVLTIQSPPLPAPDREEFKEVNEADAAEVGAEMGADMAANAEEQMLKTMKGRKDSVLVVFEGEVTVSNAKYRPKTTPNVVLLHHMDFDKVVANEQGKQLLSEGTGIGGLVSRGVPGVIAEEPGKTILVTFK